MLKLILVFTLVMGGGGFGAYKWITKLQTDNQILQVNQSKLEGAVAASKAALEKDRNNLTKKLGRHELDILAAAKPGLVVKIINRASKNELRCFEIQSGSPLTHDELAARKKSEINGECPGIANPNFGIEES